MDSAASVCLCLMYLCVCVNVDVTGTWIVSKKRTSKIFFMTMAISY